ncbi:MAG: hypothetical protein ABI539_09955, partial [Acidobacteriota bacterium]
FGLCALAWAFPQYWSLSLIYLHPLVALWFLDRQIRRTNPQWRRPFHLCIATIPVFLSILWITLDGKPDLPEETRLIWRIAQHAGSELLPAFSSHFLIAAHVFLETIHYFVWLLLIPLVDKRAIPWQFSTVPMFARRTGLRIAFSAVVVAGVIIVLALWTSFTIDYLATRDIYFAFAIGHVLAEVPFLIKAI